MRMWTKSVSQALLRSTVPVLTLLMAGCAPTDKNQETSTASAPITSGSPGGFVVVSGDDADDTGHGGGNAYGNLYKNLFAKALSESKIVGATKDILNIGSNAPPATTSFDTWRTNTTTPLGATVDFAASLPGGIAGVDFTQYKMIFIASVDIQTPGGLTPAQLAQLNTRAADIKDYVNTKGGSLIALTESDAIGGWGWLPVTLDIFDIAFQNAVPTADLLAISPTTTDANMDHNAFHNVFSGPPGYSGLSKLALKNEGSAACPAAGGCNGFPVILGGLGTVLTAEVCNDSIDNDGDNLADNDDPDCQRCGDGDPTDPGEQCDDGNVANGDGCSATCQIENQPPVARCIDRIVNADGTCSASADINNGSSDPDGDPITCVQSPTTFAGAGATTVSLTCTDGTVASSCTATVTVVDTTAPAVLCPGNLVVECGNNGAPAVFSATATDNCGAITATCAPPSGSAFPVGTTAASCSAVDSAGNASSCNFNVTVSDTQAPVVTSTGAGTIWPPNHKARTVTLADCGITIADACQGPLTLGAASAHITCVTSDEPKNSGGDGNTGNDITIVNATTVQVLSERQGTGDGRVYKVGFRVTDAANNTTDGVCQITVPHDQSPPAAAAIDSGVQYTVCAP